MHISAHYNISLYSYMTDDLSVCYTLLPLSHSSSLGMVNHCTSVYIIALCTLQCSILLYFSCLEGITNICCPDGTGYVPATGRAVIIGVAVLINI